MAIACIVAGALVAAMVVVVGQARWARRRMQGQALANNEQRGVLRGDRPTLTMWAVGELASVGAGASGNGKSMVARSAAELSRLSGRRVRWQARGRGGLRAAQVSLDQLPTTSDAAPDLLIFILGVSDTVCLRRVSAWRRDLTMLLETVRTRISDTVPVLFTGIPPMQRLSLLPRPLRWLLGIHGARLDRALCDFARTQARVWYLAAPEPDGYLVTVEGGLQPDERSSQHWGRTLAQGCVAVLSPHSADGRGVPGLHMMVGGVGGGELRLR